MSLLNPLDDSVETAFSPTATSVLYRPLNIVSLLCWKIEVCSVPLLVPRAFACIHGEKRVLVGTDNKGNTGMKESTVTSPALAVFS